MSLGASAKRVPALGSNSISEANYRKVAWLLWGQRGINKVQSVYGYDEFATKFGERKSDRFGAYVLKSFYDTLDDNITVESIVCPFVASNAVQASGAINDSADAELFSIKAGYRNVPDKSLFGNDIAYKVSSAENVSFSLRANTAVGATSLIVTGATNLEKGYLLRIADDSKEEYFSVLEVNKETGEITCPALTNAYTASGAKVYRVDWSLHLAVKRNGMYEEVEKLKWKNIPFQNSTSGMQERVNDQLTGSQYVVLDYNESNATAVEDILPATSSDWTQLTGGSDGTAPADNDWSTLKEELKDEDAFFFCAPESSSITHNVNMALFATSGEKFFYYETLPQGANEETLKLYGDSLRRPVVFSMSPDDKWKKVADESSASGSKWIPPTGIAIAHWYNMNKLYGFGQVAAGTEDAVNISADVDDSNGLRHNKGVGETMVIDYSQNLSRYQQGKGILLNTARTRSTDEGYHWQQQIVFWLLGKKSILSFLKSIEQRKSGRVVQRQVYMKMYAWFKGYYKAGVFFEGYKEDGSPTDFEDVVKISNDNTVNALSDIAAGRMVNFGQFVMAPPVESPELHLASAGVTTITATRTL